MSGSRSISRPVKGWFRQLRSSLDVHTLPILLVAATLVTSLGAADSKLERQYQNQQGKLRGQGNVVKKVKILIKMSNIDLKLVSRKIKGGRYSEADRLLMRYVGTIRQAAQVLKDSKRDPLRKPAGFKHLEISLRKQLRQLGDFRDLYPFDRQEAINRTIDCAEAVKQRMIVALFGPDNTGRPPHQSSEVGESGTLADLSLCRAE